MPLTAEVNGIRVLSEDFSLEKYKKDKNLFTSLCCPYCQGRMMFVSRPGYINFFRHFAQCSSQIERHPESQEHLLAKQTVAHWLKDSLSNFPGASVYLEYKMPECGKHGRIADVAVVYPSGFIHIWEIQLSPISTTLLEERTKDYANAGAEVTWVFGEKSCNSFIEEWAIEHYGEIHEIEFYLEHEK